jgi:hypothetical protein
VGLSFGAVLTLTTPSAPTVSTVVATGITSTAATFNGTGTPNRDTTTGWFRYSTTNPAACDDTFGTRTPATGGSALGDGTAPVSFSQPITGLTAATTYYVCAIAANSVGTRFGTVQTFTTLNAPTVVTLPPTAVAATTATLNGSANPNGAATTGWFRYSTVNPVTCTDTFGARTPSTGGTSLGAGTSSSPWTALLSGLAQGTTYFVCAIASNSAGTSFGAPVSFTTLGPPNVLSEAATSVASTSATLNGAANPDGAAATAYFRYSVTNPVNCNDTFGARLPATGGTSLGSGTNFAPFTEALSGLTPATLYYFCAIAQNLVGTRFGLVLSFTTTSAPSVTTGAASLVTSTTATLNASVNPRRAATSAWLRYATSSPGTCNDTFGTATAATSLIAGSSSVAVEQAIAGLTAGTTYFYCALASNSVGTTTGSVLSFTTVDAPTVTTAAATSVTGSTAVLNGSANPMGAVSVGHYRYSATSPGTCNDTFGTRTPTTGGSPLGAGFTNTAFAQTASGLASSTTYYFCAIAQNLAGTSVGTVMNFTTLSTPAVTTVAASAVSASGAALGASASPNGASSTGYFRYSTVDPGSCNDTFGTRTPLSGGTSLGSGTTAVNYSQPLTGLSSGTTYYFCALAQSSVGVGVGAVSSFTTLAAPTVATLAATDVSSTIATLNGLANARGDVTTAYFRYATVNPVTCNTAFGTRAPTTGGTTLGPVAGDAPFSQALWGLAQSTTYYYCAITTNSVGTSLGTVMRFTTTTGPTVSTNPATSVTGTTATLNAGANPLGEATTGWFRYSDHEPRQRATTRSAPASPASGGTDLGSGTTSQPFNGVAPPASPRAYAVLLLRASPRARRARGTALGARSSRSPSPRPPVTVSHHGPAWRAPPRRRRFDRHGQPGGSSRRLAGTATRPPTPRDVQRHLRHPGACEWWRGQHWQWHQRDCLLPDGDGFDPRHHLLLLRHRQECRGPVTRLGVVSDHPHVARRDHQRSDGAERDAGDAQRFRQPSGGGGDWLVPLRDDEPGHVQ